MPLAVGIVQYGVPFTRMAVELRTGLSDALILILQRFLTLRFVESSILHDSYFCHTLMEPSGPWWCYSLSQLAPGGGWSLFPPPKPGYLRSSWLHYSVSSLHFMPWSLRENVAAKALSHQIVDLQPPNVAAFGRLLGRMEEGKGQAYSTGIDVPCSDRNRLIPEAHSHCHWRAWHEVFCHAWPAYQSMDGLSGRKSHTDTSEPLRSPSGALSWTLRATSWPQWKLFKSRRGQCCRNSTMNQVPAIRTRCLQVATHASNGANHGSRWPPGSLLDCV